MLRLPRFDVEMPVTVADAVTALNKPGARLIAGGTDLLPNLKHRLEAPQRLVSLSRVRELEAIDVDHDQGQLQVGAGCTLTTVAQSPRVSSYAPSLATAAGLVASPLIRNMATLGGNVNLDTRCRYVNQTEFWRSAIGGCLKSEGDVCHVVPGGKNCVAAMSSDCVPVLISLDAMLLQVGPKGARQVAMRDYYVADGIRHTTRLEGEMTTAVVIPIPQGPRRCAYNKWTVRGSIDFPLTSVALRFDLHDDDVASPITAVHVVVGVLGARPRIVTRLDDVIGKRLNDPAVAQLVAERVNKQCKPLANVPYEAPYRREMLRVHTRRAIEALVEAG